MIHLSAQVELVELETLQVIVKNIYSRYRYITHFYCLAVEAGFYSDVLECLPVDPASWVRFPAWAGKIFLLYDNGAPRWVPFSPVGCFKYGIDLHIHNLYSFRDMNLKFSKRLVFDIVTI